MTDNPLSPQGIAAQIVRDKLKWVRSFISYARYELQPGESRMGDQFPRQADADKAMAEIDAVLEALASTLTEARNVSERLSESTAVLQAAATSDDECIQRLRADRDELRRWYDEACVEKSTWRERAAEAEAALAEAQRGPHRSMGTITIDKATGEETWAPRSDQAEARRSRDEGWQHIWCPNCNEVVKLLRDNLGPDPETFDACDLVCADCKFIIATLHRPSRQEEG